MIEDCWLQRTDLEILMEYLSHQWIPTHVKPALDRVQAALSDDLSWTGLRAYCEALTAEQLPSSETPV